jgi:cobalt-zinc-cadmium efflux system outer membrane protein
MNNEKLKIKNYQEERSLPVSSITSAVLFLTMILFFNKSISGQTIDSLINEAVNNNPKLKSLEYNVEASKFRSESINNIPPPNLSIEFSQVPINEYDIFNQSISNSIALSQMFPLGGKPSAMAEVENKNTLVEENNFDSYKINLIAQLKMSYYSLWLIDRKIEVQKNNISLLKEFEKANEVSLSINRINQADILTVQSEIELNETQLLILQKQKEAEIYKLNKLLGRKLDSKEVFAVAELKTDSLSITQAQLEELLNDSNPSLKKMNNMVEMNKAMITANNKEMIPDLMVQGMLMRMPRGMILTSKTDLSMLAMETPQTEYMYSLMASINLPFAPWSINKYSAKEEELAAGIKGIEEERNDMQREMTANLSEALVKYKTAKELTELYDKKVIPSYMSSTESQVTAYQSGKTGITTVLDSYRMLLMQKMNYYMSKADVQMAIAEVEMMVGTNLNNYLLSKGIN